MQINKKTLKTEYDNYKTLLESNSIVFLNAKRIERKWITSVEFAYLSKFSILKLEMPLFLIGIWIKGK